MTPDGVVRALVGGRNYGESQFNRAIDAKRQPGSAFKPFVYLTALEHGLMPDTVREDAPIAVKGWKPENFEHQYWGPVTLTQALANSLNTVSVRLTLEFGPDAVIRTAYRLGINSQLEPNASIALGTSEVSPFELVTAYATFANGGFAISPHVVERIRTADGKTLYERSAQPLGRIVDDRYIGMMNTMMHETLLSGTARRPACRAGRPPAKPAPARISVTPGSSATPRTSSPASGSATTTIHPTKRAVGGGLPVEIWSRFMKVAHAGIAPTPLPGLADGSWFNPAPPAARPAVAATDGQSGNQQNSWRRARFLAARQIVRTAVNRSAADRGALFFEAGFA